MKLTLSLIGDKNFVVDGCSTEQIDEFIEGLQRQQPWQIFVMGDEKFGFKLSDLICFVIRPDDALKV